MHKSSALATAATSAASTAATATAAAATAAALGLHCRMFGCGALQNGDTALHAACRGRQLAVAKLLLELMSREAALGLNKVGTS